MRALFLLIILCSTFQVFAIDPQKNNVIWRSPSNSSNGSMPLGNGDIGLNVWAHDNGTISFYISKTDAWEENGRLLKIGKVNISISPNPFHGSTTFSQTLNIKDGTIEVKSGNGAEAVKFILWVDANNPVIHFDADLPEKSILIANTEIWRTTAQTMTKLEVSDINYFPKIYGPTIIQPDVVINAPGKVVWYHLNPELPGFKTNLQAQGLDGFEVKNPLKDRIFGALMQGDSFNTKDDKTLVSTSGKHRSLSISVLTQQPATANTWLSAIKKIQQKNSQQKSVTLFEKHKAWWHNFWNRSGVEISINDSIHTLLGMENQGTVLTRGYTLQRFITACGGRGNYPIKFNGSIFTVDADGAEGYGDYRRWGTGYWWQNSRIPLLSMPASGDTEMMFPLFNMYFDQLPLAKYRTNMAFQHHGAYFAECVYPWGAVFTESWGRKHINDQIDRLQESGYHKYEWVCGLELATMMYDYYLYKQDRKFAKEILLPLTEQVLLFFQQHYKTDETGHLKFQPSQALETWWTCTNALPEVAGVNYLVKKIKTMPQEMLSDNMKKLINTLEKIAPPIPTRVLDGKTMLAPAQKFEVHNNVENPELYAIFPFRLFGIGKPALDLAVNAYLYRDAKGAEGWRQDELFAALLGLTGEAKAGILKRASSWDQKQRFPAFWGPNYDWTPDQDHGGMLQKALQSMLLQCDEKEIRLFPAWPREWNVNFKLMAPYQTTIECSYKDGEIINLKVTPESRKKDVIIVP